MSDLQSGCDEEANQLLADHVNRPMESDSQHIRFLLVRVGKEKSYLGLQFDHRLFDAYGAETFFRLIDETSRGRLDEVASKIKTTEPAHLDHWKRRFASGKILNRLLVNLQKKDVRALAMPPASSRKICLLHESLTVDQTVALNKKAFSEIGVPILLPSAAARGGRRAAGDSDYAPGWVAISAFYFHQLARAGDEWSSIFFNHFSFVYFSAPTEEKQTIRSVALALRDQFFQHIKDKIPHAMQDAAALGRIFPRPIVGKVINSMFKGRMCSFYFACLKEAGFTGTSFMGNEAVNLYHTPLAFAPPGLNLCMTFFAGHFNLVLSYVEGAIDEPVGAKSCCDSNPHWSRPRQVISPGRFYRWVFWAAHRFERTPPAL